MKRGSVDWTVGKLLTIVLLVVLLVLVIYGVSVGGFNPLKERIGGMMDSVSLLFFGGDGRVDLECADPKDVTVGELGGAKLTRCKDHCELELDEAFDSFGFKKYFYEDKNFYYVMGHNKISQNYNLIDIEKANFYRAINSELKKRVLGLNVRGDNLGIVMNFNQEKAKLRVRLRKKTSLYEEDTRVSYFYEWDGDEWVNGKGEKMSKEEFVSSIISDYKFGALLDWGYYDEYENSIEKGLSQQDLLDLFDGIIAAMDYADYVLEDYNLDEIIGTSIVYDGKEYEIKSSWDVLDERFLYVDYNDDKVGVYLDGEYLVFYSEKYKDEPRRVVSLGTSFFNEISNLNKIYDYLKDRC